MPYNKITPKTDGTVDLERFIKELDFTTETVKTLLHDNREIGKVLPKLVSDLEHACGEIKQISDTIRGGGSGLSLATKVALLEDNLKDSNENYKVSQNYIVEEVKKLDNAIKEITKERKDELRQSMLSSTNIDIADKTGKWQTKAAAITGVLALLTSLITVVATLLK